MKAFQYPATEVFSADGGYTVAWSVEQYEALLAEGWLAERPIVAEDPEPPAVKPKRGGGKAVIIPPAPDAA